MHMQAGIKLLIKNQIGVALSRFCLMSNYRGIAVIPPKLWRLNIDPPDGSTASFDVDERWWDQVELTRLDLSSNEIKELSEDIENFKSLSALEVRKKM